MTLDFKLLTIYIPTYNGAKYIENSINRLLELIEKDNSRLLKKLETFKFTDYKSGILNVLERTGGNYVKD